MATQDEIKPDKLYRHKGGKIYKVCPVRVWEGKNYVSTGVPRWGRQIGADGRPVYGEPNEHGARYPLPDPSKVWAVQWKVCPKYPEGREYQADRELKIKDLTPLD